MYLMEILKSKELLDKKISEIKKILLVMQNDDLAQELFGLLELRQSKLLNIDAANNSKSIKIGNTEVNVSVAIRIRDTIKEKIDTITDLIDNEECTLDKIELQKQRDKFYDDFILLDMAIKRNDLSVTIT